MPKLVLKTIVGDYGFNFKLKTVVTDYGFNLKKFKTVVTNYGFDEDPLVWAFFKKNVLDWYFKEKMYYFGTKLASWTLDADISSLETFMLGMRFASLLDFCG